MSGDIFSNESGSAVTVRPARDAQAAPYLTSTENHSPDGTGSPPTAFMQSSPRAGRYSQQQRNVSGKPRPAQLNDRRSPEARDDLRRLWGQAQRNAAEMVLASESEDRIALSNAASDLDQVLVRMWDLREFRETDWRSVLNFLQGVMRYAWKISGGFETLSVRHCQAIEEVVKHNLGPATMDKEDVRSTLSKLESAGLDPWAAISGDPEE